ncbi:hypothetical protein [Photobacterium galatheae]|uniref:Type 4 fimbrial biogenesis protein PilX N-terminal domain-containing protein n=1 Tax=Photobacterium galatheae TaxID=1654360 RepID=A0A066RRY4_9GAMM|nr:hypothetical protein [Photobacterium galatheae]KDM91886.1 hypothetical protein EA58_09155 [Photobacterium galatheae]MCM0147701.1 hypothetical protein [Photobacterium galatheae]
MIVRSRPDMQGMATLLITSMMLSVAMVFVLSSAGTTLYQVKRAQNSVLSRQAHWLAEGGLICAFHQFQAQLKTQSTPLFEITAETMPDIMPETKLEAGLATCNQSDDTRQLTVQVAQVHDGRYQFSAASLVAGKARVRLAQQAEILVCRSEEPSDCRVWSDAEKAQAGEQVVLRWVRGSWHDF